MCGCIDEDVSADDNNIKSFIIYMEKKWEILEVINIVLNQQYKNADKSVIKGLLN